MQYIEAPSNERPKHLSVMLAGGITNCADWQAELISYLQGADISVFNPRRAQFPLGDPEAGKVQIAWEFEKLRMADIVVFWFSRGSINPIALLEYGSAIERLPPECIVVGVDPAYERKFDVYEQTRHARPDIKICDDISLLSTRILIKRAMQIDGVRGQIRAPYEYARGHESRSVIPTLAVVWRSLLGKKA